MTHHDLQTAALSLQYPATELGVQANLEEIRIQLAEKLGQAAQNIIASGQLLLQAKLLLRHGNFRKWLDQNFSMSAKTANRFMAVAQMAQRHQLEGEALSRLLSLDLKTLYELAAKSTPNEIQSEVLISLEQRDISYEDLRFLKRQYGLTGQSAQSGPQELQHFKHRLHQFKDWLSVQHPRLERPRLTPHDRQDLIECARQLKQASDFLEELLTQQAIVTMSAPGNEANTALAPLD